MSLLALVKKKKACSCGCSASETGESSCPVINEEIRSIKVLGAGCKSCREQYENVKKAIAEMGLSVEAEYITDMEKVMSYGVMSMPAIVVNERVVSMGKVLKIPDVKKLLSAEGER